MVFKPGQSGNLKGRPLKNRALTDTLRNTCAGTNKRRIAEKIRSAILTGYVLLDAPDAPTEDNPQGKAQVLRLASDEWIGMVRFLFAQVDGPPPTKLEATGADGGPIVVSNEQSLHDFTGDELIRMRQIYETANARRDQGGTGGT